MSDGSEWVTWDQAAEMIGCSRTSLNRMVRDGLVVSRRAGRTMPSLSRVSVEAAAVVWGQRRADDERARAERDASRGSWGPPEDGEVWLSSTEAALVLGMTSLGVRYRAIQGLIPAVQRGNGRWWFRRDHVEQAAAARAFRAWAHSKAPPPPRG